MLRPNRAGSKSPAGKPVPAGNPAPHAPGDRERERNTRTHVDLPDVLDAQGVQYVILDLKSDGDLHLIMQSQPRWSVNYVDGEGAIFARASGEPLPGREYCPPAPMK